MNLEITHIETVAVNAPLAREFRGSHYRMTRRATVITRVHTADGIVGEAYVGDEEAHLETLRAITAASSSPPGSPAADSRAGNQRSATD